LRKFSNFHLSHVFAVGYDLDFFGQRPAKGGVGTGNVCIFSSKGGAGERKCAPDATQLLSVCSDVRQRVSVDCDADAFHLKDLAYLRAGPAEEGFREQKCLCVYNSTAGILPV